jgi:hypothetical protein
MWIFFNIFLIYNAVISYCRYKDQNRHKPTRLIQLQTSQVTRQLSKNSYYATK